MSEGHQSNNGEEREGVGPNGRPQKTMDEIFAEYNARFSPEMGFEAAIYLLHSANAATRAHMREVGDSGRRDALREASESLDRALREVRTPIEESSSNQMETQSSEERADTQDSTNRNAQGAGCNQTVGFNGCAPTHAVEAVRRFGRLGRRTQASSVTPRRLEAWEHDSGFPPYTHGAEEDRTVERPTSGPSSASEPMPKVKSPGVPSVILPIQDGDADNSEDSSGESTSSSSSSSSGEHVAWTEDDYKKPREEPASPRAGPSNGSRRSKGKQIVRPRANRTASHDSRRLSVPLALDTISERSETSSRKPSPVPTEVRNSSERSDATSVPIAQGISSEMANTTSITIAQGDALDIGASTLMSAEQSSYAEAVKSGTGNVNAGELPGTSSSTVTSQVEGAPQPPNLTSQPGNNGRTNGSRTTLNRWRKRAPTAQPSGGQPKPETKDAGDGRPHVGHRRMAEEMLAKVKARLKKYLRRMKGHCYREIKRIVEDLVHVGPG